MAQGLSWYVCDVTRTVDGQFFFEAGTLEDARGLAAELADEYLATQPDTLDVRVYEDVPPPRYSFIWNEDDGWVVNK